MASKSVSLGLGKSPINEETMDEVDIRTSSTGKFAKRNGISTSMSSKLEVEEWEAKLEILEMKPSWITKSKRLMVSYATI